MFSESERIESRRGQESVWEYPRPPRIERVSEMLRVAFASITIAETRNGFRVLETSHPPVFYFPPEDVKTQFLVASPKKSYCEFKGIASYWTVDVLGKRSNNAAWSYPHPSNGFRVLTNSIAFYASRVDDCWVGAERVQAQTSDFYGGWITSNLIGPFKGPPGTLGW